MAGAECLDELEVIKAIGHICSQILQIKLLCFFFFFAGYIPVKSFFPSLAIVLRLCSKLFC